MDSPGFPQLMVHPHHVAATISGPENPIPGKPEMFPPIEVHSPDQEERERARGYLRYGEQMEKIVEYSVFPKALVHPGHIDAMPPSQGATLDNGRLVTSLIPGTPEKYPDVFVKNEAEEAEWRAKGYTEAGTSDEYAFEKALLSPGQPGSEYPKWVDGVLVQDPDLPEDLTRDYPKWLHFSNGDSLIAKDPRDEERILRSRGEAVPVKPEPKPYVATPPEDAEMAEFRAWKAAKQADEERAAFMATDQAEAEEREALYALAEEGGIKIDRRWRLDRLRETVMGREDAAE
jgi:hypothetical protein